MSDDMIRAWLRADGWTEIEWPGGCARYKSAAEADAHVAGMRAAFGMAVQTIERQMHEFSDERQRD